MGLACKLRAETRAEHKKVENAELLRRVFSPEFDVESYRQLLCRWHGFFCVMDRTLEGFRFNGYEYPPRGSALERDLEYLGIDVDQEPCFQYGGWTPAQFEEKLGCVYVIEGSSLGAKIISRQLEKALGKWVTNCAAFYQMQPYKWALVQAWLDEMGEEAYCDQGAVVDSAKKIFVEIHDHMDV